MDKITKTPPKVVIYSNGGGFAQWSMKTLKIISCNLKANRASLYVEQRVHGLLVKIVK